MRLCTLFPDKECFFNAIYLLIKVKRDMTTCHLKSDSWNFGLDKNSWHERMQLALPWILEKLQPVNSHSLWFFPYYLKCYFLMCLYILEHSRAKNTRNLYSCANLNLVCPNLILSGNSWNAFVFESFISKNQNCTGKFQMSFSHGYIMQIYDNNHQHNSTMHKNNHFIGIVNHYCF